MRSEHAGHDHTHGMAKQTLRLAFFLSLIIVAAEVGGGLLAHSLNGLSESGVFSCTAGMVRDAGGRPISW